MAKDAAAAAQQRAPKEAASDPAPAEEQTAAAATAAAPPPAASSSAAARRQRQAAPAAPLVAPSTVVNLAVHSLLMITVPFALFFTSLLGGLDRTLLIVLSAQHAQRMHAWCQPRQAAPAEAARQQQQQQHVSRHKTPVSHSTRTAPSPRCCMPAGLPFPARAALFTLTGARVPGREAKAYIGAVLAVLGVNAVSCVWPRCCCTNCSRVLQQLAALQLASPPAALCSVGLSCAAAPCCECVLASQVIASFVVAAFREDSKPDVKQD